MFLKMTCTHQRTSVSSASVLVFVLTRTMKKTNLGKRPWERSAHPTLRSQPTWLSWLACRSTLALYLQLLTVIRADWELGGVASLRQRKAAPTQTRSYWPLVIILLADRGGKQSYPAAISARLGPITTRQRANSKQK